jgi:hypothetical protein
MMTIGGGMAGIAYGIALLLFERFTRRRIRLFVAIPAVVTGTFAIAAVIAEIEFRQKEIEWFLAQQLLAIVFGLLVSAVVSRRK